MSTNNESTNDERYRPRTTPPTTEFGKLVNRFSKRVNYPCDNCENESLDQWITEGATAVAAVCPTCGHVHDNDRAHELYERHVETDREGRE